MKKLFTLFLFSFLLVACKQSYSLSLLVDGKTIDTGINEFKASSDEEAYRQAVELINDFFSSTTEEYLNSTISFSVCGKNGVPLKERDYYVPKIIKLQEERRLAEQLEFMKAEEKKAFGGAEFGMSLKEVLNLPTFKDYSKTNNIQLTGIHKYIGDEYYDIFLLFGENDELYTVLFSSITSSNADYLNTVTKRKVDNLKEIIQNVYGEPHFDYGYPSILDLRAGETRLVYLWNIGNKAIRIGVQANNDGYRHRINAEICDTMRAQENNSIRKAREKERKQKVIDDASTLF